MTDVASEMIERAKQGNKQAFDELAKVHLPEVYNIAYRYGGNRADAEDIVQLAMLRLWQNLKHYDSARSFRPWFRRLVVNVCLNYKRKQKIDAKAFGTEKAKTDEVKEEKRNTTIFQLVAGLPFEQRLAVVYKYCEDLDVSEIAEIMNVPEGTIKTWLFRARENLRAVLSERGLL